MALRYNTYRIDSYEDRGDHIRIRAIARAAGVLKYRSDAGDRYELVSPQFNQALDSDGFPYIGQLGGAPVTLEHPPTLIRENDALVNQYQCGQVEPKIKVFKNGDVEVWMDVFDSNAIAAVKSGEKKGVSLGYQTQVIPRKGVWNGQRHTHVQIEPLRVDHLAIVASPRAPRALITHVDSAERADVAWHSSLEDSDSDLTERADTAMLKSLLARMDKKAGGQSKKCPGGYSIPASKNCRGSTTAKKESASLGKLGKKKEGLAADVRAERIAELKAGKAGRTRAFFEKIEKDVASSPIAAQRDKGKQAITKEVKKRTSSNKAKATRAANKAAKNRSSESLLNSLADSFDSDELIPITFDGHTYHLDAEDYLALIEAYPHLDEDEEDYDEDEEYMDSTDSIALLRRIDSLEAQLSLTTALLARRDQEDEEEDDEEYMDSLIQERVSGILSAYADAIDYLPADFDVSTCTDAIQIKAAAVLNFDAELEGKLDSEDAIEGAYAVLEQYAGGSAPGVRMLRDAVDSAPGVRMLRDAVDSAQVGNPRRDGLRDVADAYSNAWKGGN